MQSTYALALLLAQSQPTTDTPHTDYDETIKRLKKEDMKSDVTSDIPVHHYNGPKKPGMPIKIRT